MGHPTARLFDAMADDYDVLEPWYEHLYATLHPIVLDALVPPRARRGRALDAGCGSGFQAALLEHLGYETHGLDVAPRLLVRARRRLPSSALIVARVEDLPYRDASFDAAVCCGSTLSFVDDPEAALRELSRTLKGGGRLVLEVEHRFSLDLLWSLTSALCGDRLGYDTAPGEAWRALARSPRRGCTVPYPGYGRLRLFTRHELTTMLARAGLRPVRWWGIHWITNLIPSTILHRDRLNTVIATLYRHLRTLDTRLSSTSSATRTANSLVVLAERAPSAGFAGAT
jgi:ubiquinone/menaquinone biosynthesis C-methylase UbiE